MNFTNFFKYSLMGVAFASLAAFTSCSDDNDDDGYDDVDLEWNQSKITFGTDGVWTGWNTDNDFSVGNFEFSHGYDGYAFGFTPSRSTDVTDYGDQALLHQFDVITGGGSDGPGTPFIVGYWDSYQETKDGKITPSCVVRMKGADGQYRSFFPESVDITNTVYTYYTMLNGNNFAKKFEQGDWLKVIATGIGVDGSSRTAEFYLANCTGTDQSKWLVNRWMEWDLSMLGWVREIQFSMQSSDTGTYGMNTPAYFAIDDLEVTIEK